MKASGWEFLISAALFGYVGYAIGGSGMRSSVATQEEMIYRMARGYSDYKAGCGRRLNDISETDAQGLAIRSARRRPVSEGDDLSLKELQKSFDALVKSFDESWAGWNYDQGECSTSPDDSEAFVWTVEYENRLEKQKSQVKP